MKQVLIGVAFIGIIASLASALFFMMKGGQPGQPDDPKRASNMVRALAMRVGLSVVLFITLRLMKGHFTPERHFGFEGAAWYWHFVDVVWLGLYILVYWM